MAKYKFSEIRKVHLELSSLCNAECPFCPRNVYGYPYNDGYTERNLTLSDVKTIFKLDFLKQINEILVNGNFGDFVMNPESLDIIEYFRSENPDMVIWISTNGGARNSDFWQKLAGLNTDVYFCIEGLEDTHSLYRKNTLFSTVIDNAKTFIDHGGSAWWKMLIFDHNQHQVEECRRLSKEMGFREFLPWKTGRDNGPVFNKKGEYIYSIGKTNEKIPTTVYPMIEKKQFPIRLDSVESEIKTIDCSVLEDFSIYVSSTGEVYPCCFLGFEPKTFGKANYMQVANQQVARLIKENNALEHDLEHCIQWFNKVVETWDIPEFKDGRLIHCNDSCGKKINSNLISTTKY